MISKAARHAAADFPRYACIEAGSNRIRLQAPAILWHAEEAAGHILESIGCRSLLFSLKEIWHPSGIS